MLSPSTDRHLYCLIICLLRRRFACGGHCISRGGRCSLIVVEIIKTIGKKEKEPTVKWKQSQQKHHIGRGAQTLGGWISSDRNKWFLLGSQVVAYMALMILNLLLERWICVLSKENRHQYAMSILREGTRKTHAMRKRKRRWSKKWRAARRRKQKPTTN